MLHNPNHQKAFSLVEMGIALLIISAIIVSITGGIVVRDKLELKRIIDGFNEISHGIQLFQNEYKNAIPGDLWNADKTLGGAALNGDGDKLINGSEYLYFWQHMSLAGMIDGTFDGTTNEPSTGVMKGVLDNSGYYIYTPSFNRVVIGFALYNDTDGSGIIDRLDGEDRIAALEPEDAWHLDEAYDDGKPGTGFIRGSEGSNASGTCLSDPNSTPADFTDDDYNLSNTNIACIVEVIVNEELLQ